MPSISVSDARAAEGGGTIDFTVKVTPPLRGRSISLDYAVIAGTATAGSDYTFELESERTSKNVRIPAGLSTYVIRVPITDDVLDEADEETLTLRLSKPLGEVVKLEGGVDSLTATGIIEDDDPTPVVSISGPDGRISYVSESSTGPVTFTLTIEGPTAETVSIDYMTGEARGVVRQRSGLTGATEGQDYVSATGTVRFQPGEKTKTVTVQLTDDDVSEDTEFFALLVRNSRNAQFKNGAAMDGAGVGILDQDMRGVTVEPTSLMLTEPKDGEKGTAESYRVALTSQPTEDVTVTVEQSGDGATLSTTTLEFTPDNWATAQGVTVTPTGDDDAVNENVMLTHILAGGDYDGLTADGVTVTVMDIDTRGVTLSTTTLAITEGGRGTYTVKLDTQPVASTTVAVTGAGDASVGPAELVFTTRNWSTPQTVTVTAVEDDDAADEPQTMVTHMATGGDYVGIGVDNVRVTITDDDDPRVSVSFEQNSYTVSEGATTSVAVRLSADPERSLSVPLTIVELGGATSTDYSGVPDSLMFSAGQTEKEFTFSATQDTEDDDDESVRVTLGTLPDRVTRGSVSTTTISIMDDDDPSVSVSFEQDSYTLSEGSTTTIGLKLSADPERSVTSTAEGR